MFIFQNFIWRIFQGEEVYCVSVLATKIPREGKTMTRGGGGGGGKFHFKFKTLCLIVP